MPIPFRAPSARRRAHAAPSTTLAPLAALASVLVLAACGAPHGGVPTATDRPEAAVPGESRLAAWRSTGIDDHFSADDIARVVSDGFRAVDGKRLPTSKAPLTATYAAGEGPDAFDDVYAPYTAATETKGFLHLGEAPAAASLARLLANVEGVSRWTGIRDASGEAVFDDAYTTDASGKKTADAADGRASADGEVRYAKLLFRTGTIAGTLPIPARISVYEREGVVQVDVENHQDVRAPLVGTVIRAGALRIHVKAYPSGNGWLFYGAAAAKLDKFQDAVKPELLGNLVDAFFTWVKDETVRPL